MTRILVCGGRDFANFKSTKATLAEEPPEVLQKLEEYKFIQASLNKITEKISENFNLNDNWLPTDITIIAGGATGVDRAAADFATVNYCQLEEYPADWKKFGRAAGYIRNKKMLEEGKPDLVVAFPGGKGTTLMVTLANKAGIKVIKMGTLGTSSQISPQADLLDDNIITFKTKRFQDAYIDRLEGLRMLGLHPTAMTKDIIL